MTPDNNNSLHPQEVVRRHRLPNTERVQVRLTATARDKIRLWAEDNQVSFSAAIEALALTGLQSEQADILVPLLHSTVQTAFQRQFNRFAKLTSFAAIEAGVSHQLLRFLLLQLIRETADPDWQQLPSKLLVNEEEEKGQAIRQLRDEIGDHALQGTLHKLRGRLMALEEIINEPLDDEESDMR